MITIGLLCTMYSVLHFIWETRRIPANLRIVKLHAWNYFNKLTLRYFWRQKTDVEMRWVESMAGNQRFRTTPWHIWTCVFPPAELLTYGSANTSSSSPIQRHWNQECVHCLTALLSVDTLTTHRWEMNNDMTYKRQDIINIPATCMFDSVPVTVITVIASLFGPERRVPKSHSSCCCCCCYQFSKNP